MGLLLSGLLIFFAIHAVPMATAQRAAWVTRVGQPLYMIVFSVLSLIGLILIVQGYSGRWQGDWNLNVWDPPAWTRHLAALAMWPAMIAIVAAYVPSNIRNLLQHPMLVAVTIWAIAHLAANGDLASIMLFGSFLIWAVIDRISLTTRSAFGPLGVRPGSLVGDVIVIAVGTGAYLAIILRLHEWLFGVAPIVVGA